MKAPVRLEQGQGEEWVEIQASEVSISNVTGGTCTFNDGYRSGKTAIIRFNITPTKVTANSGLANIVVGTVDAVVTLNGQYFFKLMGVGSTGAFGLTTYIASEGKVRTRTFGLAANSPMVMTVFCALT